MSTIELFAVDLDEEILSHLADDESVKAFRVERLDPQLIEDETIREIYEWQMAHIREHGKPATPSVLSEEFDLDFEEPLTAVGDLVERLRDRFAQNHTRERMEIIANAYKSDPRAVPGKMLEVGRELNDLLTKHGEQYGPGDYERIISEYDKRVLQGPGASFGFKDLDDYFFGMRGVNMFIGAPKTGKSWLGVNSMLENVLQGKKVRHESLELPASETNERLLCMAANIPPWRFLKNALTKEDRTLLKQVDELLLDSGLYLIEKPAPGNRTIDEMVDHARNDDVDVIYIDQLQYVETRGIQLGAGDHKDYWSVLNRARDLSDDGPICFIHQFNRSVQFSDKMPDMQQAKGAAACEEVPSLVLGMWANKDMRRSGILELGSIASRHYNLQSWEIAMDLNRGCRFECIGIADHEDE